MSKIEVRLQSANRCLVVHLPTGSQISTDTPPEYGGGGTTFSSTDLVAAGLGSCIGSSLGPIVVREGLDLSAVKIRVEKKLGAKPKRLERLLVTIEILSTLTRRQLSLLKNAAKSCTVHRSIGHCVDIQMKIDLS